MSGEIKVEQHNISSANNMASSSGQEEGTTPTNHNDVHFVAERVEPKRSPAKGSGRKHFFFADPLYFGRFKEPTTSNHLAIMHIDKLKAEFYKDSYARLKKLRPDVSKMLTDPEELKKLKNLQFLHSVGLLQILNNQTEMNQLIELSNTPEILRRRMLENLDDTERHREHLPETKWEIENTETLGRLKLVKRLHSLELQGLFSSEAKIVELKTMLETMMPQEELCELKRLMGISIVNRNREAVLPNIEGMLSACEYFAVRNVHPDQLQRLEKNLAMLNQLDLRGTKSLDRFKLKNALNNTRYRTPMENQKLQVLETIAQSETLLKINIDQIYQDLPSLIEMQRASKNALSIYERMKELKILENAQKEGRLGMLTDGNQLKELRTMLTKLQHQHQEDCKDALGTPEIGIILRELEEFEQLLKQLKDLVSLQMKGEMENMRKRFDPQKFENEKKRLADQVLNQKIKRKKRFKYLHKLEELKKKHRLYTDMKLLKGAIMAIECTVLYPSTSTAPSSACPAITRVGTGNRPTPIDLSKIVDYQVFGEKFSCDTSYGKLKIITQKPTDDDIKILQDGVGPTETIGNPPLAGTEMKAVTLFGNNIAPSEADLHLSAAAAASAEVSAMEVELQL